MAVTGQSSMTRAPAHELGFDFDSLQSNISTCAGSGSSEGSAQSSRIQDAISGTVKRSVHVADVHQRIQFLGFAGIQNVGFGAERLAEGMQPFVFIQSLLSKMNDFNQIDLHWKVDYFGGCDEKSAVDDVARIDSRFLFQTRQEVVGVSQKGHVHIRRPQSKCHQ